MKKTISERLEDARMALEAMDGELADIACELPCGSDKSEAILNFRYRLASLLKSAGLPKLEDDAHV